MRTRFSSRCVSSDLGLRHNDRVQPAKARISPVWIILGILGALMLCCCGGGGLLGFLGFRRGAEVDKEAKLFATPAITAIGKDWSKERPCRNMPRLRSCLS